MEEDGLKGDRRVRNVAMWRAGGRFGICIEKIGTEQQQRAVSLVSFRFVSFRLVPVSVRYVTFARPCISSRNIGAE